MVKVRKTHPTPDVADPEVTPLARMARKRDKISDALADSQCRFRDTNRRFLDFIYASSDWLWESDPNGRILFLSDRMTEILGQPAVLSRGRRLLDLCRPVDDDDPDGARQAVAERRPFRDCLIDIDTFGGGVRRCRFSGTPVFDKESDTFIGFRGAGTDITAQHEAEQTTLNSQDEREAALAVVKQKNQELARALERAQASAHAKGEFLANMSHELRTPLNAVIGFSEMLEGEVLGPLGDPRYRDRARDILHNAHRLLEIITNVLDMAKFEAGRLVLDEEEVEVGTVIEAIIARFADRAAGAGVTVETATGMVSHRLRCDRRLLVQMLANIVANGVEFTPQGGTVTVGAGRTPDGGLEIRVADNGPGIDAATRRHLLTPMAPFDAAAPRPAPSIGLPLVKAMVELHGGALGLESRDGEGTTATLTFPADRTTP